MPKASGLVPVMVRGDQMTVLKKASTTTRVSIAQMVRDALDVYFKIGPGREVLERSGSDEQYDVDLTLRKLAEVREDLIRTADALRDLTRKTRKFRHEERKRAQRKNESASVDVHHEQEDHAA